MIDFAQKYIKKPPTDVVGAVQFSGWEMAYALWVWTDNAVLYVPRNAESGFRSGFDSEFSNDRDPFLLVNLGEPVGICRCNLGDWLVKGDSGLSIHANKSFQENFQLVPGWGTVFE